MINAGEITGIILAGGESSRMGKDKAMLDIAGKSALERSVDMMKGIFSSLIISADIIEKFRSDYPVVADIYKARGPIGGIYTGLIHSSNEVNFVLSVDMPFISPDLIEYIIEEYSGEDVLLPLEDNMPQAHCAIYTKNCLPKMKIIIEQNKDLSLKNLIKHVNSGSVEVSGLPFYDQKLFFNMNTPDEYTSVINSIK